MVLQHEFPLAVPAACRENAAMLHSRAFPEAVNYKTS